MPDTLITPEYTIQVERCQYGGFIKVAKGPLYINKQDVKPHEDAYRFGRNSSFDTFYGKWLKNEADWYRGFNCSHFSYEELQQHGILRSEGTADVPRFTMGETEKKKKTLWLPGCWDRLLCESVSVSGTDPFMVELSKDDSSSRIPCGITVVASLGTSLGIDLAWISGGEQLVRGPLNGNQFRVCSILWYMKGRRVICSFNGGFENLPPLRPWKPDSKEVIEAWWEDECKPWLDVNSDQPEAPGVYEEEPMPVPAHMALAREPDLDNEGTTKRCSVM